MNKTSKIHPLFLKILAEHFPNIEDGKIKNVEGTK